MFWQDVAPIYNTKCVRCHQEGGIAPFRLDTYADAKDHAALEKARVAEGTMPPYFMVNDGSCQSFQDDVTLTAAQKAIVAAWVDGGAPEGTPVTLTLPPQPMLAAPST
jgi:mono/diheme cytochrome c family protein